MYFYSLKFQVLIFIDVNHFGETLRSDEYVKVDIQILGN